jgi:Putative addiction module component
MSATIEQLAEQARKLPVESRAKLADLLVESFDADELNQIGQAWLAEARRRRDELRDGKSKTLNGPEALRKVRETPANDLEIINRRADDLNEEALDVLDYQVAL